MPGGNGFEEASADNLAAIPDSLLLEVAVGLRQARFDVEDGSTQMWVGFRIPAISVPRPPPTSTMLPMPWKSKADATASRTCSVPDCMASLKIAAFAGSWTSCSQCDIPKTCSKAGSPVERVHQSAERFVTLIAPGHAAEASRQVPVALRYRRCPKAPVFGFGEDAGGRKAAKDSPERFGPNSGRRRKVVCVAGSVCNQVG